MWQQKQLLNQYHSEDRSKAKDNDKLKEYKIVFDGKIIGRYHPNNPLRNDNIEITDHRIPTKRAGNISLEIIFSDWSGNKAVWRKTIKVTQPIVAKGNKAPAGHYTNNGNGTITDTKTGLMWTKKDSRADLGKCLNWNNAKKYVSRLNTGGHSNWRMPTVQELKTIYEKSMSNDMSYNHLLPLHFDSIFADSAAYGFWTSEEAGSCCALLVSFYGGSIYEDTRVDCGEFGVRAVRQ